MELAGPGALRAVSPEITWESDGWDGCGSAGGRERVSSMDSLDLNVSQRPKCQKLGCRRGTARCSNPGELEPWEVFRASRGPEVDSTTPVLLLCLPRFSQNLSGFTPLEASTRMCLMSLKPFGQSTTD